MQANRDTRGGQQALVLTHGCLETLALGQTPTWEKYRSRPGDPTPLYDELMAETAREGRREEARRYAADLAGIRIPSRPLSYQAHARRSDPRTSHQAAASVVDPNVGTYKRITALFKALDPYGIGFTDEELADTWASSVGAHGYPPISDSGLRTRRNELTGEGRIVDSGQKRKTRAGRNATVWRLA